jgi:hypothetical protein
MSRRARLALTLISAFAVLVGPGVARADDHRLLLASAIENADQTVATLPVFMGTSHGQVVWYVVTESSDPEDAEARGVNFAPKLLNAVGTAAVQQARMVDGMLDFPATVHFGLGRTVEPGPTGFPPTAAKPGAIGETRSETGAADYTPLVSLPNGIVLNAPHVATGATASAKANKVAWLDLPSHTVGYRETPGLLSNNDVHYLSFEASIEVAAALEDVTFAPALNSAPGFGSDDEDDTSARAALIAFANGQLDAMNPQRQGLNSAILDGLSPLNVVNVAPGSSIYSPLWDVRMAAWTPAATAAGANTRQGDHVGILGLVDEGLITAPDGSPFGAAGFVVNCPVVSVN